MVNNLLKTLTLLVLSGAIISCSKDTPTIEESTELSKMYFFDSSVSGLRYITQSGIDSITKDGGILECIDSETVGFYLGNVQIGDDVICSNEKTILPTDLINPMTTTSDTQEVIAIALILQSLDNDGDASNGISINSSVHNYDYSSVIDLYDDTDIDANDKSDNLESFMSEINLSSGVTIQNITETNARDHMRISFGSNTGDSGVTNSLTNSTNLGSACPTSINVVISNNNIYTSAYGGAGIDFRDFIVNSATRNLSTNSYSIEMQTNDDSYDIGTCGDSVFMKAVLSVTGTASFTSAGSAPTISGSYHYAVTCLDSSITNVCVGTY